MDGTIKNRLILILGILTVIFLSLTVISCLNAQRYRSTRDTEMRTRLELEEKMDKLGQERQAAEKKLAAMNLELAQEKSTYDATRKDLVQEKAVALSLKEELAKVKRLNDKLEDALKEALAARKTAEIK